MIQIDLQNVINGESYPMKIIKGMKTICLSISLQFYFLMDRKQACTKDFKKCGTVFNEGYKWFWKNAAMFDILDVLE